MNNFRKIKKILEFVWLNEYSNFYRDKYSKAGINLIKDVNSLEDFKKLPYLTKKEIVNSDPFDRFFLPWEEFGSVGISSGTSGETGSLSIIFSQINQLSFIKKAKHNNSNLFKPTSIMRLLAPIQIARALIESIPLTRKFQTITTLGDIHNLSLSAKIAAKLKIDLLATSPTILYFFLPYLKKEYNLEHIKRISLLGEHCSKQKALLFKKAFPGTEFTYNYGMSEVQSGTLGTCCKYLDSLTTSFFHPTANFHYETIDNNGDKELIITDISSNGFPLIRYKTGDSIEMEDYDCECGVKQKFKVLGRINYDNVKIHGVTVYAHLIEKVLSPFFKYLSSPDFQLHISEDLEKGNIYPCFKLQLVLKKNYQNQANKIKNLIIEGVSENLYLSAKRTLTSLVTEGIFKPLEIEFIKDFPVSNKHKRIISHLN